jgi:hypothetical protein
MAASRFSSTFKSRLACDEPFGPELTAEGLSRVEAAPTFHLGIQTSFL